MDRVFKPKFEIPKDAEVLDFNHPGMVVWRNPKNKFTVCVVHYTADPKKRSEEWYQTATANLREDQKQREYEIDFTSRAGQKAFWYLEPNKHIYQIDDFDLKKIPEHWRIFAGLDFGATNPTSIHLYGVNEKGQIFSLFEFYKPSHYREIARVLKGKHEMYPHPLWKRVEAVVADPSIWKNDQHEPMREEMTSLADLIEGEGIYNLEKAQNARVAGLERIKELLNFDPNKKIIEPNMFFCRSCRAQWREFTNLVIEEVAPERLGDKNLNEDVKKKDDHSYDEARYVAMRVRNGLSPKITAPKGQFLLANVEADMDREDFDSFY